MAQVPDDNPRLQAEGFVKGLNSEVTDLVVQRQLIAVRMRKRISEYKLKDAEKLYEDFRGLKTLNDLQQMLNIQLQRMPKTSSPFVKQKIDKMYSEERELLNKHIDAELQVKLFAELTQAKAAPPPAEEEPDAPKNLLKEDADKKPKLPEALQPKGGENTGK